MSTAPDVDAPLSLNRETVKQLVADRTRIDRKVVAQVIVVLFDVLADALVRGDKVQMAGFGTWETKKRHRRPGKNPKTGAGLVIAERRKVVFRTGKNLDELVNAGMPSSLPADAPPAETGELETAL